MNITTALDNLNTTENAYRNTVISHFDTRTEQSRQDVTDALATFTSARQVVRDLAGTPTYRR